MSKHPFSLLLAAVTVWLGLTSMVSAQALQMETIRFYDQAPVEAGSCFVGHDAVLSENAGQYELELTQFWEGPCFQPMILPQPRLLVVQRTPDECNVITYQGRLIEEGQQLNIILKDYRSSTCANRSPAPLSLEILLGSGSPVVILEGLLNIPPS